MPLDFPLKEIMVVKRHFMNVRDKHNQFQNLNMVGFAVQNKTFPSSPCFLLVYEESRARIANKPSSVPYNNNNNGLAFESDIKVPEKIKSKPKR